MTTKKQPNDYSVGQLLRTAVNDNRPLIVAGTINAFGALLAERAGIKAIYLSGAGVANASFGIPDLGLTTLEQLSEEVQRITAVSTLPLLVDIDTGFNDPATTVRTLKSIGAAGIQIEDQIADKRCGHRPNKSIVSPSEMQERIRSCLEGRDDHDFVVMARTDAFANEGLTAAIDRAQSYVAAGADMIFAEALTDLSEYKEFCNNISVPVLANMTEFGNTPTFTAKEFSRVGVKIVLYPLTVFRAMNATALNVYSTLQKSGSQKNILNQLQTRDELYEILKYYDAETEVDEKLKLGRVEKNKKKNNSAGMGDVIAGTTEICTVGKDGIGLSYRGYTIEDLANNASFEEVAYLLLYKELPNREQLDTYQLKLRQLRELPAELKSMLEQIPASTHPMDVMRTGCSLLGCLEPEVDTDTQYDIANRLIAILPSILLYWHCFHVHKKRIDTDTNENSLAGHFLHLLNGKPVSQLFIDAMNASLILYAEHEFNASTFAARVTTSTLSDFYSAVVSAIGTLRGPLHGGANEAAMALIERCKNLNEVESMLVTALTNKEKIMGFGHRVYKESDPRSPIIKAWSLQLSDAVNNRLMFEISNKIESVMWNKKSLFPNLDFYSASAYHFMGIPVSLFTPIFVCSRITGWAAHIVEQRQNNALIRPGASYNGPEPKKYIPINDR